MQLYYIMCFTQTAALHSPLILIKLAIMHMVRTVFCIEVHSSASLFALLSIDRLAELSVYNLHLQRTDKQSVLVRYWIKTPSEAQTTCKSAAESAVRKNSAKVSLIFSPKTVYLF